MTPTATALFVAESSEMRVECGALSHTQRLVLSPLRIDVRALCISKLVPVGALVDLNLGQLTERREGNRHS